MFSELTQVFNQAQKRYKVRYETKTLYTPDIRLPENRYFSALNQAYRKVMHEDCSFIGIGGGTDAKGHPELLAVGPLFSPQMGPPINFHGENEGAPLEHLKKSAKILYYAIATAMDTGM